MKLNAPILLAVCLAPIYTVHAAPYSATPTINIDPKDSYSPSESSGVPADSSSHPSGKDQTWTVIVDKDDPRSLSDLFVEMELDPTQLKHVYNNTAFKGFAGSLSSKCVQKMSTMSGLKTFEPEMTVTVSNIQPNAPWGLQRISEGPINQIPYSEAAISDYDFQYQFNGDRTKLGKDVDIYIVDTGINYKHIDFDGRARIGFTIDDDTDSQGHGTHCAGTAGSTTFGVAKAANIIGVKVLGTEEGSSSDIVKGIDWVMQNHEMRKTQTDWAGSVASMSLGSPVRSSSIDEAVKQASANGVHFSVAAGNENQMACNSSPAGVSVDCEAISVGAITIDDTRATFSNYGECTTIFAPGEDVISTWIGGDNKINTLSGTSMAAPHITGLIACLLVDNPDLKDNPRAMKELLLQKATHLNTDRGMVKVANNGVDERVQQPVSS